jgi:hypothetical protein
VISLAVFFCADAARNQAHLGHRGMSGQWAEWAEGLSRSRGICASGERGALI